MVIRFLYRFSRRLCTIGTWFREYQYKCFAIFAGALNLTHEAFHSTVAPTAISNVGCDGTENELTECSYSTMNTCDLLNDAGVICQGQTA